MLSKLSLGLGLVSLLVCGSYGDCENVPDVSTFPAIASSDSHLRMAFSKTNMETREECIEAQKYDVVFNAGWDFDTLVYYCIYSTDESFDFGYSTPYYYVDFYDPHRTQAAKGNQGLSIVSKAKEGSRYSGFKTYFKEISRVFKTHSLEFDECEGNHMFFAESYLTEKDYPVLRSPMLRIERPDSKIFAWAVRSSRPEDIAECYSDDVSYASGVDLSTRENGNVFVCAVFEWLLYGGYSAMTWQYAPTDDLGSVTYVTDLSYQGKLYGRPKDRTRKPSVTSNFDRDCQCAEIRSSILPASGSYSVTVTAMMANVGVDDVTQTKTINVYY